MKTWRQPETENYAQWALAAIAGALTLAVVPLFRLIVVIYPLYVIVMNSLIVSIKYIRSRVYDKE